MYINSPILPTFISVKDVWKYLDHKIAFINLPIQKMGIRPQIGR